MPVMQHHIHKGTFKPDRHLFSRRRTIHTFIESERHAVPADQTYRVLLPEQNTPADHTYARKHSVGEKIEKSGSHACNILISAMQCMTEGKTALTSTEHKKKTDAFPVIRHPAVSVKSSQSVYSSDILHGICLFPCEERN